MQMKNKGFTLIRILQFISIILILLIIAIAMSKVIDDMSIYDKENPYIKSSKAYDVFEFDKHLWIQFSYNDNVHHPDCRCRKGKINENSNN